MAKQVSSRGDIGRHVPQRDIAARAGVSVSTVSRVLNNASTISAAVRGRVLAAAGDLGYWDGLPSRPSVVGHVGLFVPLVQGLPSLDMYGDSILGGVEAECRRQGMHFSYTVMEPAARHAATVLDTVRRNGIDAVILLAEDDAAFVAALLAARLPVVLVNTEQPELAVDSFVPDYYTGAVWVTRHLLAHGHRRILHVTRLWRPTFHRRLEGHHAALREAGIAPERSLVLDLPSLDAPVVQRRVREWLTTAPEDVRAIFCVNDFAAIGAMRAVREAGRRIPEDCAVVGYDDVPMAAFTDPPLTTVRVERTVLGAMAVRRVVERASTPDLVPMRVTLATRLVERQSVAG